MTDQPHDEMLEHHLLEEGNKAVAQAAFWAGLLGAVGTVFLPALSAAGQAQGLMIPTLFCAWGAVSSYGVNWLAKRRRLHGRLAYVTFAIYVSLPTFLFVTAHFVLPAGAASFALGPLAFVYCLLIVVSGCLFDPRLCVFTGTVAAVGYGVVGLLAMPVFAALPVVDPILHQDLASASIWVNRVMVVGFMGLTVATLSRVARRLAESTVAEARQKAIEEQQLALAQAQIALAQSEKMAALGQLVAGVAHELNTPLGAIRASVSNLEAAVQHAVFEVPARLSELPAAQRAEVLALVEAASVLQAPMTSREHRAARRALRAELEALGVERASEFADTLVDVGITTVGEHESLLRGPGAPAMLESAYNLAALQRNAATIDTAAARAAKIVTALKSHAHPGGEGAAAQEGTLSEQIDTVLTLYGNSLRQGVKLVRNFADPGVVVAQHQALDQVWTNLVHNALQAMDGTGTLSVSVSADDDVVSVQIGDTGPGIPAAIRSRIFEPFFTTKEVGQGTGLGLSICRDIVTAHGGEIAVASEPGKTVFTVRLGRSPEVRL